ncbi:flagellar hook-length control protein FliK [Pseudorhodobacter sp.]|uniref:flagellar hook-length control protein FliK n=1 Tax=Pseudorhodobacter sp. TaxID=1934400 RepID=UPI00264A3349|nr:flagellar hook-length control protein FliK [Pseudorhodobacter sp.]MDN5787030.1 flagellar hook-length control protein FliK [Pseudorhodobacter sp.]
MINIDHHTSAGSHRQGTAPPVRTGASTGDGAFMALMVESVALSTIAVPVAEVTGTQNRAEADGPTEMPAPPLPVRLGLDDFLWPAADVAGMVGTAQETTAQRNLVPDMTRGNGPAATSRAAAIDGCDDRSENQPATPPILVPTPSEGTTNAVESHATGQTQAKSPAPTGNAQLLTSASDLPATISPLQRSDIEVSRRLLLAEDMSDRGAAPVPAPLGVQAKRGADAEYRPVEPGPMHMPTAATPNSAEPGVIDRAATPNAAENAVLCLPRHLAGQPTDGQTPTQSVPGQRAAPDASDSDDLAIVQPIATKAQEEPYRSAATSAATSPATPLQQSDDSTTPVATRNLVMMVAQYSQVSNPEMLRPRAENASGAATQIQSNVTVPAVVSIRRLQMSEPVAQQTPFDLKESPLVSAMVSGDAANNAENLPHIVTALQDQAIGKAGLHSRDIATPKALAVDRPAQYIPEFQYAPAPTNERSLMPPANAITTTAQPHPSPSVTVQHIPAAIREHANSEKPLALELTLAPEELGRIRLHLQPEGDGIRILVRAERPETLDLLRRNIETFGAELRQSGFSAASFSFGGWGGGQPGANSRPDKDDHPHGFLVAPAMEPTQTTSARPNGKTLDLRV